MDIDHDPNRNAPGSRASSYAYLVSFLFVLTVAAGLVAWYFDLL
jgi:hypothetical protein